MRRALFGAVFASAFAFVFVACGGDGNSVEDGPSGTSAGTGGKKPSTSKGGSGGTSSAGGNGSSAGGTGGMGPIVTGGGGTMSAGGSGTGGSGTGGMGTGGTGTGGMGKGGNGGSGGELCTNDPPPDPKIKRVCKPNPDKKPECELPDMPGFMPEGPNGNGFDDDCDGQADQGCPCPQAGVTGECYNMPSSQTTGMPDFKVVGVCATLSKGKKECKAFPKGEFSETLWDGPCSGKKPPEDDACIPGDLNCDGVEGNAPGGCKCKPKDPVKCPQAPLYTRPFPNRAKVGQLTSDPSPGAPLTIDGIDAKTWFDETALAPVGGFDQAVTNWRWVVTGGPCDDILPHPTFGMFPSANGSNWTDPNSGHLGQQQNLLPLYPKDKQADPTFQDDPTVPKNKHGYLAQGPRPNGQPTPSKVYPAFSLSGDYYVTGKFTYKDPADPSKTLEGQCTQVVKVRAPGLRVELCWPTHPDGDPLTDPASNQNDNDVDLHLARLQGNEGAPKHGWFTTAGNAPAADDCYYSPLSACGNRFDPSGAKTAGWYSPEAVEITPEPEGSGVCHGWGSRRFDGSVAGTSYRPCANPRLDRDLISCNPSIDNPDAPENDVGQVGDNPETFCGPENINIDGQALKSGDKFAIGVQCYNCAVGENSASAAQNAARPRVNVYCDGEYQLGFGYDPQKQASDPQYPALFTEGQSKFGSLWSVAVVEWNGSANGKPCTITPVSSGPEWNKDEWHQNANGSQFYCVNNGPLDSGGANYTPPKPPTVDWPFTAGGGIPGNADAFCGY